MYIGTYTRWGNFSNSTNAISRRFTYDDKYIFSSIIFDFFSFFFLPHHLKRCLWYQTRIFFSFFRSPWKLTSEFRTRPEKDRTFTVVRHCRLITMRNWKQLPRIYYTEEFTTKSSCIHRVRRRESLLAKVVVPYLRNCRLRLLIFLASINFAKSLKPYTTTNSPNILCFQTTANEGSFYRVYNYFQLCCKD